MSLCSSNFVCLSSALLSRCVSRTELCNYVMERYLFENKFHDSQAMSFRQCQGYFVIFFKKKYLSKPTHTDSNVETQESHIWHINCF